MSDEQYRRMQCPHCKVTGEHSVTVRAIYEPDGNRRTGWCCINCVAIQLEPLTEPSKAEDWAQHKARL